MRTIITLFVLSLLIAQCGPPATADGKSAPADTLLLSAGNGKAVGPEIKYMPEWKAFGWFTAKDQVEWTVDLPKGGKYAVELEWSVSDDEAGKTFRLQSGTAELTGTVAPSGSWETYKTAGIGTIVLPAGTQKLVFGPQTDFGKGALLDFRSLKLVRAN